MGVIFLSLPLATLMSHPVQSRKYPALTGSKKADLNTGGRIFYLRSTITLATEAAALNDTAGFLQRSYALVVANSLQSNRSGVG